MTEERKTELLKLAKGCWQREIVSYLLRWGVIDNPTGAVLKGRARNYARRYQESFQNLRQRLESAGVRLEYIPGPRGGAHLARYKMVI